MALNFDAQITELTKDITKLEQKQDKSKAEERKLRDLTKARASIEAKLRASLTGNKKAPSEEPYSVETYQKAFREAAGECKDKDHFGICIFDKLPSKLGQTSKHETSSAFDIGEPLPGVNEFHNDSMAAAKICSDKTPGKEPTLKCLNEEVSKRQELRADSKFGLGEPSQNQTGSAETEPPKTLKPEVQDALLKMYEEAQKHGHKL